MKTRILLLLISFGIASSCNDDDDKYLEFTGNETTYQLLQASSYEIEGAVTFKERFDGSALIEVQLARTEGEVYFPVHLHFGDIYQADAEIAASLTPVHGQTGKSSTLLKYLVNETSVSYNDLLQMDAHIKIHLSPEGYDYKTILAAGNVGSNGIEISKDTFSGRITIPVCKPY